MKEDSNLLNYPELSGYSLSGYPRQIDPSCYLTAKDLVELAPILLNRLRQFLQFTNYKLYFPRKEVATSPEWLEEEKTLLLPLIRYKQVLAMLALENVELAKNLDFNQKLEATESIEIEASEIEAIATEATATKTEQNSTEQKTKDLTYILPLLPKILDLTLEFMQYLNFSRLDLHTGLFNEHSLYSRLEAEVEQIKNKLKPVGEMGDLSASPPWHRLCLGIVFIRLENARNIAANVGFQTSDSLMLKTAKAIKAIVEEHKSNICLARIGRFSFAALLPAITGRADCQRWAELATESIAKISVKHPLNDKIIRPKVGLGYAIYPQDMAGAELGLSHSEQFHILMERARLAARLASQRNSGSIMPFARILQNGGTILEILNLGRLRITLGKQAKAKEGQRFSVWDSISGQYRGEVVLLQINDQDSIAQTVHLADSAKPLEIGCRLALIAQDKFKDKLLAKQQKTLNAEEANQAEIADSLPALNYGEFLNLFATAIEKEENFSISILRLTQNEELSQNLSSFLEIFKNTSYLSEKERENILIGQYGENGLIFYQPKLKQAKVLQIWQQLCQDFSQKFANQPPEFGIGVASYPFLRYYKAEMPECALKALEYALLLPYPHIGECNSLAINISADRRYSLGDIFGAIEEYKLALLADPSNVLSWNSLGTCYAALGRHYDSQRYFNEALQRANDEQQIAQTHYNLGTVALQLHEKNNALQHFQQCIQSDPQHLYALIRIGQLHEDNLEYDLAKEYYEKAAILENNDEANSGLAQRCLAKLASRQNNEGEAQELLHDALLRNPADTSAMLMLAKIHLEDGTDPSVAEALARKSLNIRDDSQGWQILARALYAQGKEEEARMADARASML